MKIRNLLSTAFMAIVASTANATDLYVYSLSSPTPVKQLNSIRYVEFGTADITVKQQMGTTTKVLLSDFDFLKFSPATIITGIGNVEDDEAFVTVSDGKVKVTGGEITGFYASDGKMLAPSNKALHEVNIPENSRHGVYIVKVKTSKGSRTYKITK